MNTGINFLVFALIQVGLILSGYAISASIQAALQ